MSGFLQVLLSGLATGSIYALAAVGFTLLWQASQTVNFAQGEFVMLPAFFALAGTTIFGMPFWLSVVVAIALSLLILGYAFKRAIVEPLLPHGVLPIVIASLGVSVFIKEAVKEFYSPQAHYFPSVFPSTTVDVFGAAVSYQNIGNIVVALLTIGGLHLFLSRTRTGRSMQATAQSPAVAEILGVNVKRMVLYTFLINAALVVVASMLISPIYLAKFSNGETIGIVAFIAAIVGGFNQIRGAFAGGILIGVLDNLTAAYVSAEYRAAVPLVLLIIIILVRPQGLLGKAEGRVV